MPARITTGFAALTAVLGTVAFAVPRPAAPLWALAGLLCATAIGLGAARHAPLSRVPWWSLAAAAATLTAGQLWYAVSPASGGAATVCNLAALLLAAVGLALLARSTVVLVDRSQTLDLLVFAGAAALVGWVAAFDPILAADHLTGTAKSILAGYAASGLIVLVAAARLAVTARPSRSLVLLLTGTAGLLLAAAWSAAGRLAGEPPPAGAALGYLLCWIGWGTAALHPSMTALTEPVDGWPIRLPGRRATLLATALAVPPVLLAVEATAAGVRDAALIGVLSLVMVALAVARLGGAVAHYRRSLVLERTLREACGALVRAADAGRVAAAVRAGVAALLPPGRPYEILLIGPDGGRLPPTPSLRRTRLIDTALLDPAVRDRMAAPGEAALVCPLRPDGAPPGAPALVVSGPRRDLVLTRNPIEVLAALATLALERIGLTEAVHRRTGDVGSMVPSDPGLGSGSGLGSGEVVLIVEPTGEIRYASESLATLVGLGPTALASLHDLVDPAEHGRVADTLRRADRDGVRDLWTLRRAGGVRVPAEATCRDLRTDRAVCGYVITLRDVSGRRELEQELIRQTLEASPAGQNRHSSAAKFR